MAATTRLRKKTKDELFAEFAGTGKLRKGAIDLDGLEGTPEEIAASQEAWGEITKWMRNFDDDWRICRKWAVDPVDESTGHKMVVIQKVEVSDIAAFVVVKCRRCPRSYQRDIDVGTGKLIGNPYSQVYGTGYLKPPGTSAAFEGQIPPTLWRLNIPSVPVDEFLASAPDDMVKAFARHHQIGNGAG